MSNEKACMKTEHNNFLTVRSKQVAPLLYQTAANLLKDTIFDPIAFLRVAIIRLSYFVRITEE